jgi:hypothetical protein
MMVVEKQKVNIRAFDNQDAHERIVINYSSVMYGDSHNSWSAVEKFFIFCKNSFFYINVDECEIENSEQFITRKIETNDFVVEKAGDYGQREILFTVKFKNKFKMLFEDRLKSIRIIENDYSMENIKGSLFKRNHIKLDDLSYVEQI